MAGLEVEGLASLLSQLETFGEEAEAIENTALKAAGKPLQEAMKRNVNRSTKDQKHIQDDIKISAVKGKAAIKYIEVGPGKATAWRAKFLEFGTSKMRPYPFVGPAEQEAKGEVLDAIARTLKSGLGL